MATKKITLVIDGTHAEADEGQTIMQVADRMGIRIPRLCYHPQLSVLGACRVCIVEVEGMRNPVAACSHPVQEGMKVRTSSPSLRRLRRDIVELILDNHPQDCQTCERDGNCELQSLSYGLGVRERLFAGERKRFPVETSSPSVWRDSEKCILCGRCIRVCDEIQGVCNLSQQRRGFGTVVAPAHEENMADSVCIHCGQCVNVCPTAALTEKDSAEMVLEALDNPELHVVVQTAPSIRAALGEGFGFPPGTPVTGKMVTALRMMGFDKVFDTDFAADLTIIEEATEFLSRIEKKGPLPLITSCSPGWVTFMERFYPEMIPHMSTCRSPMGMLSVLIKTHYARKAGIDPARVYVVAIMPCTAKKFEARRAEMYLDGRPTTDAVLTTRELIWLTNCLGVDFANLPDSEFDTPLGVSSGAGDIFGATGGVMEAALRTAYEKVTGQTCPSLDFIEVRGVTGGVREATLDLKGRKINVAVANGLNSAKSLLDKVQSGEKQYHLIEIMACPGGCVAGGGQPYPPKGMYVLDPELAKLRAKALYAIDSRKRLRKSHENPAIQELYKDFLGEPNGHLAHELLHTHYMKREPRGIR